MQFNGYNQQRAGFPNFPNQQRRFSNQSGFSKPVFNPAAKNAPGVNARLGPAPGQKTTPKQETKPAPVRTPIGGPANKPGDKKPLISAPAKPAPITAPTTKPAPISAPKPAPISAPKPAPISAPAAAPSAPANNGAAPKPAPLGTRNLLNRFQSDDDVKILSQNKSSPAANQGQRGGATPNNLQGQRPAPLMNNQNRAAPQNNQRAAPQNNQPQNNQRAVPQNNQRAVPQNNQRAMPQNNQRAMPQNNQRATPQNNQRATPQNQRATPQNNQRAAPQNNQRAAPQNNQRDASQNNKRDASQTSPRAAAQNKNQQQQSQANNPGKDNDQKQEAKADEGAAPISSRLGPKNVAKDNQQNRRGNKDESGRDNYRRDASRGRRQYNYQDNFWHKINEIGGEQYELEALDLTEPKFNNQARLFIGSLPKDATEEEITEIFSKYGEVGDLFHSKEGSYAFINYDYRCNAEKAVKELMGTVIRGRRLLIRCAAISSGIQVKNLSPTVTNELLHKAFSCFGPIELCRVSVDERGKSIGSGHLIFSEKRSAVMAYKRCQEGAFFLTAALRPVIVEPWENRDNDEGFTEANIQRNELYRSERHVGPRFAETNSYEADYGKRWKQLFDIYREKKTALENDLKAEIEALEVKMQLVVHQAETEKLRKELAQREQEALQLQLGLGTYGEHARPTQLTAGEDFAAPSNPAAKRSYEYYDDKSTYEKPAKRQQYDNYYRGGQQQYETREYDTTQQKSYAAVVSGVSGASYDATSYSQEDTEPKAAAGGVQDLTSAVYEALGGSSDSSAYSNYQRAQAKDTDFSAPNKRRY